MKLEYERKRPGAPDKSQTRFHFEVSNLLIVAAISAFLIFSSVFVFTLLNSKEKMYAF